MRLILHIGTEKTGSTSIQEHLDAHRAHLANAGIALPDFLESSNHRALASVFMRDGLEDEYLQAHQLVESEPRRLRREQLMASLQRDLQEQGPGIHSYLISSEHFHSRLVYASEVQAFAAALMPMFDDVKVICYLRRQDRMALSFFTQKLRVGFIPPSILPIASVRNRAPVLPPFFDFAALLGRWSDAFGSAALEPRLYTPSELLRGDVVADFYQRIGCDLPALESNARANPSLSAAAQGALLVFNRAQGSGPESRVRSDALRQELIQFLQGQSVGAGMQPSRDEAEEFLAFFADSNAEVAQRWFAREKLFPSLADEYPAEQLEPDWQTAAQLLAGFVISRDVPR